MDKAKNEPGEFYGHKIKKYDHKLALTALELMKDDGRAAIIIDGTPANIYPLTFWNKYGQYTKGQERDFWFCLYQNYNVVDVLYLNGDKLYKRQGQSTNVRLILIDGRRKDENVFPPVYNPEYDKLTNSFDQLYYRIMKTTDNLLQLNANHVKETTLDGPYFPQSKSGRLDLEVPHSMDTEIP